MLTAEENELLTRVGPGTPCGDMLRPLSCNWLQCEENTGDVTHTYFLHGHMMAKNGLRGGEYYYRPFAQYGFQPFKWGLLKDWIAEGPRGGLGWGNLLVFPNMLRLSFSMHGRVPVDDAHTRMFWLNFTHPRGDLRRPLHAGGRAVWEGETPTIGATGCTTRPRRRTGSRPS